MLNIQWLDSSFEPDASASEPVVFPDVAMATDYAFALFKSTGRDVGGSNGFVLRDAAGTVVDMWRTDGRHAELRGMGPRSSTLAIVDAREAQDRAFPPGPPHRARARGRRMLWQYPAAYRPAVAALALVCLAGIYAPPLPGSLALPPSADAATPPAAIPQQASTQQAAAEPSPGHRLDGEGRSVYETPLPQGPPGGYAPVAAPARSLSALPIPVVGEALGGRVPPPLAGGRREQEAMVPPVGPSAVPRVHHRRSSKRTRDDKARRV